MNDMKGKTLRVGDEVLVQFVGTDYFMVGRMIDKDVTGDWAPKNCSLMCVEFQNSKAYSHAYRLDIYKLPEDKAKRDAKLCLLKLQDLLKEM